MKPHALLPTLVAAAMFAASSASAADPTKQECISANSDAQDLRHAGKLHAARQKLAMCVAQSCPGPVREDCAQRLDEVNAAMPTVVFEVRDPGGNDVSAVHVGLDGQPLADKLDGSALQVDPGEHRFAFDDLDGLAHTERSIVLREGDRERHVGVVLGASSAAPPANVASAASTPTSDSSSQRTIAFVLGGAGVVGLVVGSVFGLVSKGTYDSALKNECGGNPNGCSTQGVEDGQSAHGQAAASTVGFVAGGLLLGAAAVLYFTAPTANVSVGTRVGPGRAGIVVAGAW